MFLRITARPSSLGKHVLTPARAQRAKENGAFSATVLVRGHWTSTTQNTTPHCISPVVRHKHPSEQRRSVSTSRSHNPNTPKMSTPNPSLIESAKRKAAEKAVSAHFSPTYQHIGIGSGSTIVYVVEAIAATLKSASPDHTITFTPTGSGSEKLVRDAGLTCVLLPDLPASTFLDVAFDGADEVDEDFNLIKGGGLCLFQEKCVALRARKFVVVADYRKDSERLLTSWGYVPVEVAPFNLAYATTEIGALLGCTGVEVQKKDGVEVRTDQGFAILMAKFGGLRMESDWKGDDAGGEERAWLPEPLARKIKSITGVLEVGLFVGVDGPTAQKRGSKFGGEKPVAVYFGMEDGGVKARGG